MRRFIMKQDFFKKYHTIYFIGIGGISMSGLAEILKSKGFSVSGSDMKSSAVTKHLCDTGIKVHIGHKAENITDDIQLVVYTAAIKEDNPELIAAKQKNIKTIDRAHLLGKIMKEYPYSIAIAGTHGKTTTTGMVSDILLCAHTDPTITVGGILPTIQSNTKVGKSSYFIAEACEYCDSFLQFYPLIGIILNIEADHLDYFKNLENIRTSFHGFANNIPPNGTLIINNQIPQLEELLKNISCHIETFGLQGNPNWKAENISHSFDGKNSFDVFHNGTFLGRVTLYVPGEHNITNALSAFAAAYTLSLPVEDIIKGLEQFHGTERRFQKKGEKNGILVIDDYAHHPTEIKMTLLAAKQKYPDRKLIAIFKPNTYSRTEAFYREFAEALNIADSTYLTEIDCNRETQEEYPGVSSQLILDLLKNGKMIDEETIDQLKDEENAVICMMSCASIEHLKQAYKDLKKEKE